MHPHPMGSPGWRESYALDHRVIVRLNFSLFAGCYHWMQAPRSMPHPLQRHSAISVTDAQVGVVTKIHSEAAWITSPARTKFPPPR